MMNINSYLSFTEALLVPNLLGVFHMLKGEQSCIHHARDRGN